MGIRYRFQDISLTSGQVLQLAPMGITCVVGANNSGKSQLLKDLVEVVRVGDGAGQYFGAPPKQRKVARSATLFFEEATDADVALWVERNSIAVDMGMPGGRTFPPTSIQSTEAQVRGAVAQGAKHGIHSLADVFIRRVPAGGLMGYATGELKTDSSPGSLNNWLIRALLENGDIERELSRIVREMFGTPCFVDRVHFPPVLRTGEVSAPSPTLDNIPHAYSKAVEACPLLDDQGDGIRSFVGLALLVIALSPSVLLLDEPESFLHPAQARAVGRWLSREASARDMQVIVATHDRDLLVGMLSAPTADVEIVRLRRAADGAEAKGLTKADLSTHWASPTMRYSNVLQGLFHERVVVCEGDVDCRFYAAAMDHAAEERDKRHVADNTLFIPSSGDGGVAKLARVLDDLDVQASAILDFDALSRKQNVKSIVEALGSDWDSELNQAWQDMEKHIPKATRDTFWGRTKKLGLTGFPPGDANRDAAALVKLLASRRVHLLEVGELEDLHRAEGKGPGWISGALDSGAHKMLDVQKLILRVLPELDDSLRSGGA